MTFTDEQELRAWLGATVGVDVAPTLTAEQVTVAVNASRVVDTDGRFVGDDGYVPTWNGYYAAALLLDVKATLAVVSRTGGVSSWSSEGTTVSRTEGSTGVDFKALADQYRRAAFPTGPVSVIDLGPATGPRPRSAWEGVTPDVDPWRT